MPRIDDRYLSNVFYLYPSEEAARSGDAIGGTGFIVGIRSEMHEQLEHLYGVTNKHVVGEQFGRSPVIRLNTTDGKVDILKFDYGDWKSHPDGDDLAMCPLDPDPTHHKVFYFDRSMFITPERIEKFSIGPGDEVIMLGRFVSHEGRQKNAPTVRHGNIAMMNEEKIRHRQGFDQESFLVEVRSQGGYSGSPVLLPLWPMVQREQTTIWRYDRLPPPLLLGIEWCFLPNWEQVVYRREPDTPPVDPAWGVRSNTGMSGVIPAWRLDALLMDEDFISQRRHDDEEFARRAGESPVELTTSSDTDFS